MGSPHRPCAAQGRGCGTPTGWRNRGRCQKCTQAHNDDSRLRRARQVGMTDEQAQTILRMLGDGADLRDAEAAVGLTGAQIRSAALLHPELDALLTAQQHTSTIRAVVEHLLAVSEGRPGQGAVTAWRQVAPELVVLERRMRDGGRRTRAERQVEQARRQEALRIANDSIIERRQAREDANRGGTFAEMVQRDRQKLAALCQKLEEGILMKEALRRIDQPPRWLTRARQRVPEAEQRITAALRAGRAARARQRKPPPLRPETQTRLDLARKLVVAALAGGASLKDAAQAGGATPEWVQEQYNRHDAFRTALRAVAAMNPDRDFDEEFSAINRAGYAHVPSPRPPKPQT